MGLGLLDCRLDGLIGLWVFLLLFGFWACGSSLCIRPIYLGALYGLIIIFFFFDK